MDLSLTCPGFCITEFKDGKAHIHHLSHVKTNADDPHGKRLRIIFDHIEKILSNTERINAVAREKAIPASRFPNHLQTVMVLNKVVGVSDLLLHHHGYNAIYEVPPTTLKKKLTTNGKATKKEVKEAVLRYLDHDIKFKNTDESDAAAVTICYGLDKGLIKGT